MNSAGYTAGDKEGNKEGNTAGKKPGIKAGDKVIQGNADIIKKGGTDHGKCFRCKIYRSDQKDR